MSFLTAITAILVACWYFSYRMPKGGLPEAGTTEWQRWNVRVGFLLWLLFSFIVAPYVIAATAEQVAVLRASMLGISIINWLRVAYLVYAAQFKKPAQRWGSVQQRLFFSLPLLYLWSFV